MCIWFDSRPEWCGVRRLSCVFCCSQSLIMLLTTKSYVICINFKTNLPQPQSSSRKVAGLIPGPCSLHVEGSLGKMLVPSLLPVAVLSLCACIWIGYPISRWRMWLKRCEGMQSLEKHYINTAHLPFYHKCEPWAVVPLVQSLLPSHTSRWTWQHLGWRGRNTPSPASPLMQSLWRKSHFSKVSHPFSRTECDRDGQPDGREPRGSSLFRCFIFSDLHMSQAECINIRGAADGNTQVP